MFDGPVETRTRRLFRVDDVGLHRDGFGLLTHLAAAQEIDAPVVRDLKQPRLQRACVVERVELAVGLKKRFLDDVLAVVTVSRNAT